jgi:hypothetical protein
MGIVELIEIALASADDRRVEVTALEPAEFSTEAVGGLAELVFELVSNAIALSAPDEKVRVDGSFDYETYIISASGRGIAISGDAIDVLNRMLEDSELTLGIASVARLAARHCLAVRLVPGAAGTSARVTVPANLVRRVESSDGQPADEQGVAPGQDARVKSQLGFVSHELDPQVGLDRVRARSETAWSDSEAFLEEVFAPLQREWQDSVRLATGSHFSGDMGRVERAQVEAPSPVQGEPHGTAASLRMQGESGERQPAAEQGVAPGQDGRVESQVDLTSYESDPWADFDHVGSRSKSLWANSEAFLEEVFAPLVKEYQDSLRSATRPTSTGDNGRVDTAPLEAPSPVDRQPSGTATALRVRVPGESFIGTEDDSPSTAAAEAAIDIRSALSTFDQGRRSAEFAADGDDDPDETSAPVKTSNLT